MNDSAESRRYLYVKLTQKLDCISLEYKQLFAHLKPELEAGNRYWSTSDEEKELMECNLLSMPIHLP